MAYPIKYIENNLVFNHDGGVLLLTMSCFLQLFFWALNRNIRYTIPSSLSPRTGTEDSRLQISTESSMGCAQERLQTGSDGQVKDVACAKIDAQTEALIST